MGVAGGEVRLVVWLVVRCGWWVWLVARCGWWCGWWCGVAGGEAGGEVWLVVR